MVSKPQRRPAPFRPAAGLREGGGGVLHGVLQIGPELHVVHGSLLLLARLFLLPLGQHPRHLGTGRKRADEFLLPLAL